MAESLSLVHTMENELDIEMANEEDGDYEGDEYEDEDDYEVNEEDIEAELEGLAEERNTTMREVLGAMVELQESVTAEETDARTNSQRRNFSVGGVTLQDLGRLLGVNFSARLSEDSAGNRTARLVDDDEEPDEDDDEEDDDGYGWGRLRHTRTAHRWFEEVKEPQPTGVSLLMSGEFGRVAPKMRSRSDRRNVAKYLFNRDTRRHPPPAKEEVIGDIVPNSNGTAVASYHTNVYCGQYSTDSTFYYTCAQDFRLHIYDTTSEPVRSRPNASGSQRNAPGQDSNLEPGHQSTMRVRKTIHGHPGRWTVTDSHLSPDNERIIYSSITPTVYMASTLDSSPAQIPINFSDASDRATRGIWGWDGGDSFGIWSCKFSADGNEVIAGGSGKIFVYDLLANRRTVRISAHNDDVNSCCWADTASGNVLISASDDTFLKVWDRRSLGASKKPSGVLVGHTEGITNVAAKGDGRYIISNGKDQALRLWDLRKMHSSQGFDKFSEEYYGLNNYDYRNGYYPKPKHTAHPQDCSVMTYRGHAVLRTLIRCHFSPPETTGSQYIYSGAADGKIHIWSLDGQVVQILDRSKTLPISFDASGPELPKPRGSGSNVCVRDVSWNAQQPVILSAGWEGGRGGSIVAKHEWKGLSKMLYSLEDWVDKDRQEGRELSQRRRGTGSRRVPGGLEDQDDPS